ncbi:major facilitator superfamily domain-containing protein [Aspergillus leporis]|uniref:Major facilitator superfamily domain-containing protein n=1 Tax=Aspergillus leporis TaxID=41062 RepID=A0A5N5WWD0_9EURO|nr:major facilitator superfamily domain-containing protein [Aspergillus leporis]
MASKENAHEAPYPQKIPYWRLLIDQGIVTPEIIEYPYKGSGTDNDPYIVEWIPNDPRNPMLFNKTLKWAYTITVAFATFGVSLSSSAYAGGIQEIIKHFGISEEVATLGVSLFVLGFAVGPLVWAPLSELIGRQIIFFVSYGALAAFCAGAAGAQNSWTLIILRFFAGSFGSSPLTNAGGVIADIFPAEQRGLATSLFAGAPFLGPTLGPVIGGFLGENAGWRWVQGFLATFTGLIWIVESLLVPETYAPLLLRKRAIRLSTLTGKTYRSKLDLERGAVSFTSAFSAALLRPWILLFAEPIVLLLSTYMAIVYGTLYMLFDAFPIVFQELRGWSEGIGSLPFLGVMVGMMIAVACNMHDNKRYVRIHKQHNGFAPPEARLPPTMIGGVAIPIGLFWFAWTNAPPVHWIVSIIAAAPFGFGMVLVFLNIMTYLIDAYTIYAASVLAANSIIRSCFGAGFPLFTAYMYRNLGVHWASCIPAFLALACLPFPFVFYKYGARIRRRCKYAAEADDFVRRLAEKTGRPVEEDKVVDEEVRAAAEGRVDIGGELTRVESGRSVSTVEEEEEGVAYKGNPYDIDRVNTRNSAISRRSRSRSTKGRRRGFLGL